ncbi:MAG: sulfatase-like hydrolase/transferase [Planctomycetaceae bacterium]
MHRFATLAAVLLVVATAVAASASDAPRPNFIVVLIDDMGYGDLSCYGNEQVTTQHIDRLAAEGIRFTQYYSAAPICSPSRVGITTGQYPARWDITSFLNHRKANRQRGMQQWLDPAAPTLARRLQSAGYATGHFGKWHMGGQRDVGEAPLISEYGFDESLTQFEGLGERVLGVFDTIHQDAGGKRGLELGSEQLGRGEIHWIKRYDVTKAFSDRAIDFIEQAKDADKPFYVNVWPDDVHSPHEPPPEFRCDSGRAAMYAGVIENMDDQLGPLFDFIREDPELRKSTLILLTSDNGPEPGAGSAGPFRGHKGQLYEGGIREPLIAWAPGLMPDDRQGSVDDEAVIGAVDVSPSLLSLAGVEPPEGVALDGIDVSAALVGRAKQPERDRPLLWNRPPDRPGPNGAWPDLAIRDGDWKLLVETDGSRPQLYDLSNDPGEERNLAADHPDVVKRLSGRVVGWHREVAPEPRP